MTQTHEQTELDCSDGARMLIERMKTNPEDFNYGGKLYRAVDAERLSVRDLKAYNDAHDRYIKEPALMVSVLQALLVQPDEDEMSKYKVQGRYGGGITGTTVNKMWFDANTQTVNGLTREMYENHIQTHKSPIKQHIEALAAEKESIAAQIYNKAFGRERIERDN